MGQVADNADGQHSDGDMPDAEAPFPVPAVLREEPSEPFLINEDDGKDGPELDEDIEQGRKIALEAQQVADDDHMARGRDRNEFRQAFHAAHNDRNQIITHVCSCNNCRLKVRGTHRTRPVTHVSIIHTSCGNASTEALNNV